MNYDTLILELFARIQSLEEQVKKLTLEVENKPKKVTTADIKEYIRGLKEKALANGKDYVELRAGDIHKKLALKNSMPMVCNAMYSVMGEKDCVLEKTNSGYSSSLTIRYNIEN